MRQNFYLINAKKIFKLQGKKKIKCFNKKSAIIKINNNKKNIRISVF